MRILHLIDSLDYGGAEQLVASLAASQAKRGHSVQIICLRDLGPKPVDLSNLRTSGVQIHTLDKPEGFHLGTLRKLARHLRHHRPDIVHTHNHLVHHYGAVAARLTRVSAVLNTLHGSDSLRMPSWAKLLFWASCMIGDRVVSVCGDVDSALRDILHLPARKRCIVENGVDLSRFLAIPRSPPTDTVTFGNIGRLEAVKDHHTLLKAFALVRARERHIKLRVLGDGSLLNELMALADSLGIAADVQFEGFSLDTAGFLAMIDIFVIPSRSEGLPLTLLEAMAAALPIVSTAVGAVPGILARSAGGWTCAPSDPEALAFAMGEALCSADLLATGSRNRQLAQGHYSVERMSRDYERIYAGSRADR